MTERCADLDEFFDGELAADQADAFRDHLATCERCERVLLGRMQESIVVQGPALAAASAMAAPPAAPLVVASDNVALVEPAADAVAAPASMTVAPAGHVVAIGRARRWRRAIAYVAAPILAAAAAVPFLCSSEPGFQLAVAFNRAPATERGAASAKPRRGLSAHTGDVVRPEVHGERHLALWVYLDEHELIARCPEYKQCRSAGGELTLELALTTRGQYTIVAVGSSEAIPAPGPTLDAALAAARTAGLRTRVKSIDVD